MATRYSWVALVVAVAMLSPAPRMPQAFAAPGQISVQSIKFFSGKHFRHDPCSPTGAAATAFPVTVRRIYTYVAYSRWNGTHADQFRWYSPDGKLYAHDRPVPFTGHGPTSDCTWLAIRGFRAASLPGRWTFRLMVDGHVFKKAHFTLVK